MSTRYRTSASNHDGGDGTAAVPGGLEVAVASPLGADPDAAATNPEQLLALAWATCLNATAQAIVKAAHRTSVRVEVELRDAEDTTGFRFHVDAFVSGEGLDAAGADALAAAAHARCPISRLLQGSSTVAVHGETFTGIGG